MEDISERDDLAGKMPQKAAQLREKLVSWRRAVNAQMPTLNPNYDPARAGLAPGEVRKRPGG